MLRMRGPKGTRNIPEPASRGSAALRSLLAALPSALALLLSIPCLGWPYLWDDFDFLARAMRFSVGDLLPQSGAALYRPLSRELYFGFLNSVGGSAVVGHVVSGALAAASVYLLLTLLRRTSGERAGVIGALLFSGSAALPFLVGWISGIQDLLCIFLILVTYHLALRQQLAPAMLAYLGAILSKETAIALAPAVFVLWRSAVPNGRHTLRALACIGAIVVAWSFLHPWTHRLIAGAEAGPVNEYVAFRGGEMVRGLARGLPSLVNLSWSTLHGWSPAIRSVGVVGSVLTLCAVFGAWRIGGVPASPRVRPGSVRLAGMLTLLGPFVLTSAFIAHWSPYYAGLSTIGLAMIAAPELARNRALAAAAVLLFLWLGLMSRTAVLEPEVPSEYNLAMTAQAMKRLQGGFMAARPKLPSGTVAYTYVQAQGRSGAYASLYRNQPIKVWYHDPTLELRDPLDSATGSRPEALFWVSPELDVAEVDLSAFPAPRVRGSGMPLASYQKSLRAYALGLAGRGRVDDAVSILTRMPQDLGADLAYDRRSAAAILLAAGRDREAEGILATTPHFHPEQSIREVGGLIAKPIPGLDLDEGALRAFDIRPDDAAAVREIMRWLAERSYGSSAARFARRLLAVAPHDPEALEVLRPSGARR